MGKILGISGSPIKNSNTDKLVNEVLRASELEAEFIKLSDLNIKPCLGCKGCVLDNKCKVNDDFNTVAEKLRDADVLVLGAYTPYSMIDGFTKSFLERLWSMRHVNGLNEGKHAVSIVTGLMPPIVDSVQQSIKLEFDMEKMVTVGSLNNLSRNVPCLTCGEGDTCKNSAIPMLGDDIPASSESCVCVTSQDVFEQATSLGKQINSLISNR